MHETHLIENMFKYLNEEEMASSKRIKRVHIALSRFGGISSRHLKSHFHGAAKGTKWESLDIKIKEIPFGPEMEINRIDYF